MTSNELENVREHSLSLKPDRKKNSRQRKGCKESERENGDSKSLFFNNNKTLIRQHIFDCYLTYTVKFRLTRKTEAVLEDRKADLQNNKVIERM